MRRRTPILITAAFVLFAAVAGATVVLRGASPAGQDAGAGVMPKPDQDSTRQASRAQRVGREGLAQPAQAVPVRPGAGGTFDGPVERLVCPPAAVACFTPPTQGPGRTQPTQSPCPPDTAGCVPPTQGPTTGPTQGPSRTQPTQGPTTEPTRGPTRNPERGTQGPSGQPTTAPTTQPTTAPTSQPTQAPTQQPTQAPTQAPTEQPTQQPTQQPRRPLLPQQQVEITPTVTRTPVVTQTTVTQTATTTPTQTATVTATSTATPAATATQTPPTQVPASAPTTAPTQAAAQQQATNGLVSGVFSGQYVSGAQRLTATQDTRVRVRYRITNNDTRPVNLGNTVVFDLADGVRAVSADPSKGAATITARQVSWGGFWLDPGESATIDLVLDVTPSPGQAGRTMVLISGVRITGVTASGGFIDIRGGGLASGLISGLAGGGFVSALGGANVNGIVLLPRTGSVAGRERDAASGLPVALAAIFVLAALPVTALVRRRLR